MLCSPKTKKFGAEKIFQFGAFVPGSRDPLHCRVRRGDSSHTDDEEVKCAGSPRVRLPEQLQQGTLTVG